MIILNGKKHNVDGVITKNHVDDHHMGFEGKPGTIPRASLPNIIIWHWTGGENQAETVYNTLIGRGLGVEFCVDREGVVWQFVDPIKFDPKDTGGGIGHRAISIEIVNFGFMPDGQLPKGKGADRPRIEEVIHGSKVTVASFYPAQIKAVFSLTRTLCAALGIPAKIPMEKKGGIALRVLTPVEQRAYVGIMGHFHKTTEKYDPGFQIFRDWADGTYGS
jgi:hypothetical protein